MASLYETKASIYMVPGFSKELKSTAVDNENQLKWPCKFILIDYYSLAICIVRATLATSFAGGAAAYGSWRFSSLLNTFIPALPTLAWNIFVMCKV